MNDTQSWEWEVANLKDELGAAREEVLSWVREVTGRDCDIDRLKASLAEAIKLLSEVATLTESPVDGCIFCGFEGGDHYRDCALDKFLKRHKENI